MRHFIALIFFIPMMLWSQSSSIPIYKSILHGLFPSKKIIRIYIDDADKKEIIQETGLPVELIANPDQADLLMLFNTVEIGVDKPVFAGTYRILKAYPTRAIGGFYWKKGRPTLIFYRHILDRHRLLLPDSLKKYME